MAEQEQIERKPPKLFYSKKIDEKHRKHFNKAIRRNSRGGDHYVTMHYVKTDGSRENKEVKPYTAKKTKDGNYLLVGYARGVGLRSYRTDRIHHIKEASMFWQGFEKRAVDIAGANPLAWYRYHKLKKDPELQRVKERLRQDPKGEPYIADFIEKQILPQITWEEAKRPTKNVHKP